MARLKVSEQRPEVSRRQLFKNQAAPNKAVFAQVANALCLKDTARGLAVSQVCFGVDVVTRWETSR